jgi:16S rRNA (guanine966-N2)-methyltransferase
MRVIAGRFRSRPLKSIPGLHTRPTPDRLRETLFNVLAGRIEGATFLDAYAGTGAVGIEALSRGASRAIFLERARGALKVLHENLVSLSLMEEAQIVAGKAAVALTRFSADIVFLDPPYDRESEYTACLDLLGESPPRLVVAQHATRFQLAGRWGALERGRLLTQGDNSLSFFEPV